MDRLLTAEEIAERLGVKTQWVWAQARAGRIPHVRLGRYRRLPRVGYRGVGLQPRG
jgi:excisionase family DNA binding protein